MTIPDIRKWAETEADTVVNAVNTVVANWRTTFLARADVWQAEVAKAIEDAKNPPPPVEPPPPAPFNPYTATKGLYVRTDSSPARLGDETVKAQIGSKPIAKWFGPTRLIEADVDALVSLAAAKQQLPVLVTYAIPNRDAGGQSRGGYGSTDEYLAWARGFAAGIGDRPAIVIVEPDAILHGGVWDSERVRALGGIIDAIHAVCPKTWIYLDTTDGRWNPPSMFAARFKQVWEPRKAKIRGYSVNISNHHTETVLREFDRLMQVAGINLPFVYDASRNGKDMGNADWCNPPGRKLGVAPIAAGNPLASIGCDAALWIKVPGESDGNCGVYPTVPSGAFSNEIARNLIDGR